jgi:dTDP-4-dehydrorhamnose reductase
MYEITEEYLTILGKQIMLEDAPPRHHLWMNCDKARRHGVVFQSVEDGLIQCAKDYNLLK